MVNTLVIIGIVVLIAIGAFIIFAPTAFGKQNDVPTLDDLLKQAGLDVPFSAGNIGLLGTPSIDDSNAQTLADIREILLAQGKITQDSLQAIAEQNNRLIQTNVPADQSGKAQTQTVSQRLPFRPESFTLVPSKLRVLGEQQSVKTTFGDPATKGILGIRGKPLGAGALVRTQNTVVGELTTKAGGKRLISGSPELFKRLQQNLLRSGSGSLT